MPYVIEIKVEKSSKAGIHGICDLQLMLQKIADSSFLQKLEGQKIKILHKTEIVFMGIITQVEWLEQSDYNCLHVHAVTISREMDIQRHSRTFQLESKTLSDVANAIAKPYGVQVAVQDNPVLPRMLYQHEETDWQFLVRLAESTGHLLFTNCASNRIALSLGFVPFSERKLATYDKNDNISLPVSTCLKVKENIRPHTMSCEFQDIGIITFDLQLTAGHGLEYEYRTQAVLESQLTSTDDLLVNHITLRHKEGCRPTAEEELRCTNAPAAYWYNTGCRGDECQGKV